MMAGKFKGDFETAIAHCPPGVVGAMDRVGGVEVFNICKVLKAVYSKAGFSYDEYLFAPYTQQTSVVKAWAEKYGAALYSRDRESFSLYEAAGEAVEAGLSRTVVEDLS